MTLSIISIIINVIYFIVLRTDLYTDRAMMPSGDTRTWRRSPISRLYIAGNEVLLYIWMAAALVSVITSILMLLGISGKIISTVRLVSMIASIVLFIIIMVVTNNTHATYA